MKSKLCVFVIIAALAQSCSAVESSPYGLPKQQLAMFKQISDYQEASLQHKYKAFDPVFDILNSLLAQFIFGLKNENDTTAATVDAALNKGYAAIDDSLNAIDLASIIYCSDSIGTARTRSHADLSDVYSLASKAIGLAATGNYGTNRGEIDVLQNAAKKDMADLANSIFGSIPTCRNATDEDTLITVKYIKSAADVDLVHIVNGVFNAIRSYAAAVATGNADVQLIYVNENARSQTKIGLRSLIEHEYSLYKALILQSNFDLPLSTLYPIEYSRTVSVYRYKVAVDTTFNTVSVRIKSLIIGLADSGHLEFSPIDAAKAETFANFIAGIRVLVSAVMKINPEASTVAAHAWERIVCTFYKDVIETFYSAILRTQAGTTVSDVSDDIDKAETKLLAEIRDFAARIDELIVQNTGVSHIQKEQFTAATSFVSAIGDVVRILASVSFTTQRVNGESVFAAIEPLRDSAFSAIDTLTQKTAELLVFQALAKK